MKSKPILELIDVSKSYEQKILLKDISFKLNSNETICLLGPSGSGKSTLLKMIAGLESLESGRILFNGVDLAQTPPHARDFGLVFQDYGLFPHLNVFDNVAFGLKMRNLPGSEIQQRVMALLDQMDLQGFAQRRVTDLSGGEQQRVALARALAPNPGLLMFDEPLGALDRNLKENLLNGLRSILKHMSIPAIYVTHDQEEAFAIADRILLLHDGGIVRAGTPTQVYADPRSVWVAQFLDIGNIIEGVIKLDGRTMKVVTSIGTFTVKCKHKHKNGDPVHLLLRQTLTGGEQIKLKVEDMLFKRDQFEVHARGGLTILLKSAPKVGQIISVRVGAECLA